jgi:hypothetical protein
MRKPMKTQDMRELSAKNTKSDNCRQAIEGIVGAPPRKKGLAFCRKRAMMGSGKRRPTPMSKTVRIVILAELLFFFLLSGIALRIAARDFFDLESRMGALEIRSSILALRVKRLEIQAEKMKRYHAVLAERSIAERIMDEQGTR